MNMHFGGKSRELGIHKKKYIFYLFIYFLLQNGQA